MAEISTDAIFIIDTTDLAQFSTAMTLSHIDIKDLGQQTRPAVVFNTTAKITQTACFLVELFLGLALGLFCPDRAPKPCFFFIELGQLSQYAE